MLTLTKKAFNEIRLWIYRNARPIELAFWQYEFENGSPDTVLSFLSSYQNPDGGFGNSLEPDSWNPDSSPYTTLFAAGILEKIKFHELNHPIIRGIIKYLDSGAECNENGWLFNIPSNDYWPHAPWWTYNPEENVYESIGVTLGLICFIIKYAGKDTELYNRAFCLAHLLIDKLIEPGEHGEMGVGGYYKLLNLIFQNGLKDKFDTDFLLIKIKDLVNSAIERDTSQWIYHKKRPSYFFSSPDSLFFEGNEELMRQELDYLIETRPENGVWGLTWTWFENNEKYPKEFAITENWWKAENAIRKVKLLKDFSRMEI